MCGVCCKLQLAAVLCRPTVSRSKTNDHRNLSLTLIVLINSLVYHSICTGYQMTSWLILVNMGIVDVVAVTKIHGAWCRMSLSDDQNVLVLQKNPEPLSILHSFAINAFCKWISSAPVDCFYFFDYGLWTNLLLSFCKFLHTWTSAWLTGKQSSTSSLMCGYGRWSFRTVKCCATPQSCFKLSEIASLHCTGTCHLLIL